MNLQGIFKQLWEEKVSFPISESNFGLRTRVQIYAFKVLFRIMFRTNIKNMMR